MSLSADDMRPCAGCGAPCDGDVCDSYCASLANENKLAHDCQACGEGCDCAEPDDCFGCSICHDTGNCACEAAE